MTRKQKRILIFLFLPAAMLDAKCTCVRPRTTRPLHPTSPTGSNVPVFSPVQEHNVEQLPSLIPAPIPIPPVSDFQPQPVMPVPIIESLPNIEELAEEEEVVMPPEKVSKDEARKVALVLSCIMATALAVVGALIAGIRRSIDAPRGTNVNDLPTLTANLKKQLEALRQQSKHNGEQLHLNSEAITRIDGKLTEIQNAASK